MSYVVLARKWRPLTFDQMVGQEFVSRTLKNAVRTGRVAHAFLFTGPRGVGKTSAARILARCLNCDQGPTEEPCNACSSCKEIIDGRSLDVYEIDGASNTSVDDIRELRENVRYLPRPGKHRIYIIDEVHMLSKSAFNALLKTLEEPPEHVIFIFATTEPHKVPETIQSRCQRFDFRRIPRNKILGRLREMARAEDLKIDDRALTAIAKAADGSMRDAQSLLDQIISYCGSSIPEEAVADILGIAGREHLTRISRAVLGQDPGQCIEALDEIHRSGCEMHQFYRDLVEHFRNLLIARLVPNPATMLEMAEAEVRDLKDQAALAGPEDLRRMVTLLLKAEEDILRSEFPRTGLEITLVKMALLSRLEPLEEVLEKIDALEASLSSPSVPPRNGERGLSRPRKIRRLSSSPPPTLPEERITDPKQDTSLGGRGAEEPNPGTSLAEPEGKMTPGVPAPPDGERDWKAFVETVRKERTLAAALLEQLDRWEIDSNRLRLFCQEGSFLDQRLRDPEVFGLLARSARKSLGPSVEVEILSQAPATENPGAPSLEEGEQEDVGRHPVPEPPQEVENDQTVQTALELFHGRIKEVRILSPDVQGKDTGEP